MSRARTLYARTESAWKERARELSTRTDNDRSRVDRCTILETMTLRKRSMELIEIASDICMGNKGNSPNQSREPSARHLQCGDRSLLDLHRRPIIHLINSIVCNRLLGRWKVFRGDDERLPGQSLASLRGSPRPHTP